jgi:hypothetical protein
MPAPKKDTEKTESVVNFEPNLELALNLSPDLKLKTTGIDCPRCNKAFICNAADIKQCQCWGVGLGVDDFTYLQQQGFSAQEQGCLCRDCLLEIQREVETIVKNS